MSLVDSAPANAASDERTKAVEESPPAVNLCLQNKNLVWNIRLQQKEQRKVVVLYNLLKNC